MLDFHARDLAVQTAVSGLTSAPNTSGLNITDLQHIDLVTQTHADLAKFLRRLAEGLREDGFAHRSLAGSLTLRSLQDVLLNPVRSGANDEGPPEPQIESGEIDLF